MSEYSATISWQRGASEPFVDQRYSRAHRWEFDGGVRVPASSSPHVVPLPWSVAENVDPEEAFVAAISSCHMLTFLWLAARAGYRVESYRDEAVGIMEANARGRQAITRVTLQPLVQFGGERQPDLAVLEQLHHQAHEECFIANSVTTVITTRIRV
ncbi:OsmC family peroxiredoxin [Aeromonas dhakensis]|uniref:OsmC family protein n=1 Tax=Aeromonas dhakensis TaxID=196024 RepID=UPI0021B3D0EA|nr:OsmC family protein [Aeromonas dhakensis]UXB13576.1 OsmC family peroxiredoxin [Aeromonas dhakensis]